MLVLLAALTAAAQQAPPARDAHLGQTAWIFSTIGHSEFCPAGDVRLDLKSGRYEHTATAARRICNDADLERPVKRGMLRADRLDAINAAYLRVLNEGLESQACRDGTQPKDVILISNGGTPILVLTTGRFSAAAPQDLSCWSDAATALHDLLDQTFTSSGQR
jgi:hypothetical protein